MTLCSFAYCPHAGVQWDAWLMLKGGCRPLSTWLRYWSALWKSNVKIGARKEQPRAAAPLNAE